MKPHELQTALAAHRVGCLVGGDQVQISTEQIIPPGAFVLILAAAAEMWVYGSVLTIHVKPEFREKRK